MLFATTRRLDLRSFSRWRTYDINPVLSDKSQLGLLLKALVGYHGNPSLTEVAAYLLYLGGIGWALRYWRSAA